MASLQKRFQLGSAVVIINSMKLDMAQKSVEAAEGAMRCVWARIITACGGWRHMPAE